MVGYTYGRCEFLLPFIPYFHLNHPYARATVEDLSTPLSEMHSQLLVSLSIVVMERECPSLSLRHSDS
jgi:hypothetical protein